MKGIADRQIFQNTNKWYTVQSTMNNTSKRCVMKVKCVICDDIKTIDNESPMAKKLRNRPIHTFMCQPCHDRIEEKTNLRIQTGNFHFRKPTTKEKDW